MATLSRIRVTWAGVPGGAGLSTFYAATEDPVVSPAELRTFFDSIKAHLAAGVSIQVPASGDTINDATGEITGTWSVSPAPTLVTSTGVGIFAAPTGAVVNWLTGAVINGRRLRGKTFLVPLDGDAYDSAGTLSAAALSVIGGAATTLATGGNSLSVWHRPTTPGGSNGSSSAITSASVPDLAAVLRSRRD